MLESHNNIYLLGIKGVAMAGIAVILKKMGKNVTGSDTEDTYITDEVLEKNQIKVLKGFDESNLPDATDLLVYSASHKGRENQEVQAALKKNIKVISQAELIGELMLQFNNKVAVAGCHGKTTTSAFLSYALIKLGVSPSYLVGAPSFNELPGADYQEKKYFVLEADEYAVNPPVDKTIKLNFLDPDYILVTNIDFDHPDVYRDIEEVKSTFLDFFKKTINKPAGIKRLFYCQDDENLVGDISSLPKELTCSFGFSDSSDFQISNTNTDKDGSTFDIKTKEKKLGQFKINLYGGKNISNAAGVIAILISLGFPVDKIKNALIGFTGAKRRFEQVYFANNVYLFDDYAHHPNEIKAVIESVKSRFPGRKINIVFQPHTYSRTDSLKEGFVEALKTVDNAFILPIFPSAREKAEDYKITSLMLEEIARGKEIISIKACQDRDELLLNLSKKIQSGDVILTLGAGNVYKLKDDIIKVIDSLC